MVLLAGVGASFVMINISIDEAWKILLALGAGTGAVFMLRWFWWRINAWSEIVAMVFSLVFFFTIDSIVENLGFGKIGGEMRMLVIALATIVIWVAATYLTPPESEETLDNFYRKIRPAGKGWHRPARYAFRGQARRAGAPFVGNAGRLPRPRLSVDRLR